MARVSVSTSQYESAHGRKPRGFGTWVFELGPSLGPVSTPTVVVHASTYGDAKKLAVKAASTKGFDSVRVCS